MLDTVVDEFRLANLSRLLKELDDKCLRGNVVEIGVWRGGTLAHMAQSSPDRLIVGFDTFTGIPVKDSDLDFHDVGDFNDTSYESVKENLKPFPNVEVHKGWFPRDFSSVINHESAGPLALIHIDTDVYQSVKECFWFLYPYLIDDGYVVFDDYAAPKCPGAAFAVHEILAALPKELVVDSLVSPQIVLRKRRNGEFPA